MDDGNRPHCRHTSCHPSRRESKQCLIVLRFYVPLDTSTQNRSFRKPISLPVLTNGECSHLEVRYNGPAHVPSKLFWTSSKQCFYDSKTSQHPKLAHGRFSRFCTAHRETTLRATFVAIGCMPASMRPNNVYKCLHDAEKRYILTIIWRTYTQSLTTSITTTTSARRN